MTPQRPGRRFARPVARMTVAPDRSTRPTKQVITYWKARPPGL
jgi:hypothetical protein